MSSVDERIVEMRFDNQQFESGVSTSLRTLDRLKDGLSGLGDSAGSLSELQAQADHFNISGIASGVDRITDRFSALGIMADQVIRLATNGLVNIGVQAAGAVRNLTFSPIATGFSQYEQETKSVQTLMNATGLSMDEVEKYTEKLGFYVDETSYSYESMFSTLASMMSSGVKDVDMGVDALVGLGNAAGLAGVDATQATHAFEGFGKAIGQGYMDSRNWSWIKTARMDTTALKQAFIDAGVSAGTLVQKVDSKTGDTLTYIADSAGKANEKLGEITAANMDNFLNQKWLTRDVMLEGVGNYSKAFNQIFDEYLKTGDDAETIIKRLGGSLDEYSLKAFRAANQTRTFTDVVEYISGAAARRWSTAFKKIFGNFEKSSELWSSLIGPLYSIFIDPLDAINDTLDEWLELGGYEHISDGVIAAFEGMNNVVTAVRTALSDIFPPATAEKVFTITEGFKNLTDKFVEFTSAVTDDDDNIIGFANETFRKLITGFKGGLSVLSLLGKGFKTFFSSLSPTTNMLKQFGSKAVDTFSKVGEFLINLNNSQKVADLFSLASEKLIAVQTKLFSIMGKINSSFLEFISAIKDDMIDGFKGIGSAVSLSWKGIKALFQALSPVADILKNIGSSLLGALSSIGIDFASVFGKIGRFITSLNECNDAGEIFNNIYSKTSEIADKVGSKFTKFRDTVKSVYENVKGFVKENLGNSFKNIFKQFDLSTVTKIVGGLGAALAGVNIYRLFDLLKWQIKGFAELGYTINDTLGSISDAFWGLGQSISAGVLIKLAVAIGLLAGSLMLLGSIKTESLVQGLFAITILLSELYAIMALFAKKDIFSTLAGEKGFLALSAASTTMLKMAASLLIMANAVKMLSSLNVDQLATGILAISVLLGALTLSSLILSRYSGEVTTGATGMIKMAASLLILAFAVKSLAKIDSGFAQGLIGTIALLGALTGAGIALGRYGGKITASAMSMIGFAAALGIMVAAVVVLSMLDANAMGNAIFGILTLLGAVAGFNAISGSAPKLLATAASLLLISGAFAIMSGALAIMSTIDANSLGNTIFGITALLAVIAGFNAISGSAGKLLATAAALILVSAAFVIMSGALTAISAIDANSLGNSIFGITALLAVLAGFNHIGGSALNMIAMGAGLLVMAVAITAIVGPLITLGSASAAAAGGIFMLVGLFAVLGVAASVLGPLAPALLAISGALLVFSLAIAIAGAGMMLLGAGMTSLAAGMTAGAAAIVASLSTLIAGIGVIGASLVGAIAILIAAIAGGIASSAVAIASAIGSLVVGVLQVLASAAPAIANAGLQLIVGLINAVSAQIGPLAVAGVALIVNFINGMAVAMNSNGPMLIAAVVNLGKAIVNTFLEVLEELVAGIPGIGGKLAQGIESLKMELDTAVAETDLSAGGEAAATSVASGVDAAAPTVQASGQNLGSNLIEGITSSMDGADGIGTTLGASLTSGLDGIGPEMFNSGSGAGTEFISGLLETNPQVQDAGTQLGNSGTEGADSTQGSWVTSGGFVASGFITGILGKLGDARSAGASLSTSAKEGADSAVEIASPSKAAMRSGEFFGEGWVIGISSMLRKAMHVGEDLGNAPMDGVSSAVSNLSQLIESGMDANPTITPVLDLSEIRSGMGELRSLTDYSMSLTAPSLSMPEQQQQSITPMQIKEFLTLGNAILKEIQNGSDLYFDDGAFAGRINRRLGSL